VRWVWESKNLCPNPPEAERTNKNIEKLTIPNLTAMLLLTAAG
jgi:hypothetical protein